MPNVYLLRNTLNISIFTHVPHRRHFLLLSAHVENIESHICKTKDKRLKMQLYLHRFILSNHLMRLQNTSFCFSLFIISIRVVRKIISCYNYKNPCHWLYEMLNSYPKELVCKCWSFLFPVTYIISTRKHFLFSLTLWTLVEKNKTTTLNQLKKGLKWI